MQSKHSLKFGTDGIRGRVGEFPFTTDVLIRLGWSIAQWVKKHYSGGAKVLIGTDTRESCADIKQALVAGLCAESIHIVDAGVIPTPAVYQLIQSHDSFNVGIVISASHNPYYDNGIKLFQANTGKLSATDEAMIVDFFVQSSEQSIITENICNIQVWDAAAETYINNITTHFKPNFLSDMSIVLDCAHGSTYQTAPTIFKALGAHVIALATNPDGKNINQACGSLHPENLQKAVIEHNADAGFAFDGDGDRVIAVNRFGQKKDGDDLLAILLDLPCFHQVDRVVGTVMTNQGFENALRKKNKTLLRTNVGDKYVVSCLDAEMLPLGGENSGHIIIKDYLTTGDGIFVALKTLESIILHKNWELTTFEKHAQILINLPIKHKKDLSEKTCADIIAAHQTELGDGRILVRYSGTENVLRIMTEALHHESADACARSLAQKLQELLNTE